MRRVCAWCNVVLAEGSPGDKVSHGICAQCLLDSGAFKILSTADALKTLPWGLLELDPEGFVLGYMPSTSQGESCAPELVLGRNFFEDVAPCREVPELKERFLALCAAGEAKKSNFSFALRSPEGATLVEVTMAYQPGEARTALYLRGQDLDVAPESASDEGASKPTPSEPSGAGEPGAEAS